MRIGGGENKYEWIDGWANIPESSSSKDGWAHHGVVVAENGDIIAYHQEDPTFLRFDREGNIKESWPTILTEAHGMVLVKEGEEEYLWVADTGSKRMSTHGYEKSRRTPDGSVALVADDDQTLGQAVKMRLDGQIVMVLETPPIEIYQDRDYSPTCVIVNEEKFGGNGDIWVADGYGQHYVHRYNKSGGYISSINGEEGDAGAFNQPHSIFVDWRKSESELYVADRANGRIQVYDLEGKFKRVFGSGELITPSAFVTYGDLMVVAELNARLTILDLQDNIVGYLGENEGVCNRDLGWPNINGDDGNPERTDLLEPGKFNSPHGLAVDKDGHLYVAEWLIGGRFTKLAKL